MVKKILHTVWKGKLECSRRLLVETLLCSSLAVTRVFSGLERLPVSVISVAE